MRILSSGFCSVITVCLVLLILAAPAGARGPGINDIGPGDTIFLYEEGLNLTGLRDSVSNIPLTALRRYSGDDPTYTLLSELPIADDTDFDVLSELVDTNPAVYYGYTPADGATQSVIVWKPELTLGVTLASPYHGDVVEGLSLPEGTAIAFRITSPYVGSAYRVGSTNYATVDVVFSTPGGAETTRLKAVDFTGIPLQAAVVYTDDPGMPGAISLSRLETGTYSVQARWNSPQAFADYADDSNSITFSVGKPSGVDITVVPTQTPTLPATHLPLTTAVPTETPLPATETPVPETSPSVSPSSPGVPVPTQAAPVLWTVCAAALIGVLFFRKR
ncbi:MAG: DUF3821 domain-containing protein [Methanomicrobiaceae archaeon]|nr:DUF3821 domain-containing protein [Methanomicrobiaceae archaeon]